MSGRSPHRLQRVEIPLRRNRLKAKPSGRLRRPWPSLGYVVEQLLRRRCGGVCSAVAYKLVDGTVVTSVRSPKKMRI